MMSCWNAVVRSRHHHGTRHDTTRHDMMVYKEEDEGIQPPADQFRSKHETSAFSLFSWTRGRQGLVSGSFLESVPPFCVFPHSRNLI
jgi:hypothetical protein